MCGGNFLLTYGPAYCSHLQASKIPDPKYEVEEVVQYGQHVLAIYMQFKLVINFMLPIEHLLIMLKIICNS